MAKKDNQPSDDENFGGEVKYYRSTIAGLSVSLSEAEDRSIVGVDEISFTPVTTHDEEKGEDVRLGYLATDEPEAQEILEDDASVTEISKADYDKAMSPEDK